MLVFRDGLIHCDWEFRAFRDSPAALNHAALAYSVLSALRCYFSVFSIIKKEHHA